MELDAEDEKKKESISRNPNEVNVKLLVHGLVPGRRDDEIVFVLINVVLTDEEVDIVLRCDCDGCIRSLILVLLVDDNNEEDDSTITAEPEPSPIVDIDAPPTAAAGAEGRTDAFFPRRLNDELIIIWIDLDLGVLLIFVFLWWREERTRSCCWNFNWYVGR